MSSWTQISLGLPKKEGDDQPVPLDFNALRREIEEGRRNSSLIHNALIHAQYIGLGGEDKYLLLAHRALKMLEEYFQREMTRLSHQPVPPVFMKESALPRDLIKSDPNRD